ncbi:hypothetical protein L917_06632 [Phytophthora nicotianae]|uniref:Uncharacterized protein n=1 Tax=Phytophthora nicotianae TaxID=4792 RepID=W2LDX1_PHYNI|nr:hypothetical protein L917_06632 [Phytophthora nicotianae]
MWFGISFKIELNQRGIDKNGNSVLLLLLNHPDITEDELRPIAELLLKHGTLRHLFNDEGESAINR